MKEINIEGINAELILDKEKIAAIFTREVTKSGTGAAINFFKDYLGKQVYILVPHDVYKEVIASRKKK